MINLIDRYLQRLTPYHREVVQMLNRNDKFTVGNITFLEPFGGAVTFEQSSYAQSDMEDYYVLTNIGYFVIQENDIKEVIRN